MDRETRLMVIDYILDYIFDLWGENVDHHVRINISVFQIEFDNEYIISINGNLNTIKLFHIPTQRVVGRYSFKTTNDLLTIIDYIFTKIGSPTSSF